MAVSASMRQTGGALLLLCVCVAHATGPSDYLTKPSAWWTTTQAKTYANNILTWQDKVLGGWPKNGDTTLPGGLQNYGSTFDNGATTPEMNYLAIAYKENGSSNTVWLAALKRAISFMLSASYPSGAIPQRLPLANTYHSLATYNDGVMAHVLNLYRSIATETRFSFIDSTTKANCLSRFYKGIDYVYKSQIKISGVYTAWGQQHDPVDYSPQWGRAYEMPCISGAESVGVANLVMSLPKTARNAKVVSDVNAWYIKAGVPDIAYVRSGECLQTVSKGAAPLWARMYDPVNGKPIFKDRTGPIVYSINEVGKERRCGYAWWGSWGRTFFAAYKKYDALPLVKDTPTPPTTPTPPSPTPTPSPPSSTGTNLVIYDNTVKSPFSTGYSWGNGVLNYLVTESTAYYKSAPRSIRYTPGNYNAVAFTCNTGCINAKTYGGVSFYVNGGLIDRAFSIRMRDSAGKDTGVAVKFTATNRVWKRIAVSFDTHFKVPKNLISVGFYIQAGASTTNSIYIDDVILVARSTVITYTLGAGESEMPRVNQTWNTTDPDSQPDEEDEDPEEPVLTDILDGEGIAPDSESLDPPTQSSSAVVTAAATSMSVVATVAAAVLLATGSLAI